MSPDKVLVGFYCAAPFKGYWNRAFVTQLPEPSVCRVFFIDYGTVADLKIERLK